MQMIQIILALSSIGLEIMLYYGTVSAYMTCSAGDCGAVHLMYIFLAPIILITILPVLIISSKKISSIESTEEEVASAHLIKKCSLISLALIVGFPFLIYIILIVADFFKAF